MKKFKHDVIIVMKKELIVDCLKKQFIGFALFFICLTIFINVNVYRSVFSRLSAVTPAIGEYMVNSSLSRTAIFSGLVIIATLFQSFSREKIDRSIETLVCYPISLDAIWIGRVLSMVITYTLSCYLIGISLFTSVCCVEGLILPIRTVTVVILVAIPPMMGTALFSAISLLCWVTKLGRIGQSLLFGLFFFAFFVGARPETNLNPWFTLSVYLVIIFISSVTALVLRRLFLNRERLILQ